MTGWVLPRAQVRGRTLVPMILIGGVRPYRTVLATVTLICGQCHNAAAHRLIQDVGKLTLFFIPTATVSKRYHVECVFCGAQNPMTKDEATELQTRAQLPDATPGTVLGTVNPPRHPAPEARRSQP